MTSPSISTSPQDLKREESGCYLINLNDQSIFKHNTTDNQTAPGLICGVVLVLGITKLTNSQLSCPNPDPIDHTVHLPHPTDCNLFYRCDHGQPVLDRCPPGLHFNPKLQVCDWPQNAGCKKHCVQLTNDDAGYWVPERCSTAEGNKGDQCSLQCKTGYELRGSAHISCTDNGWNSTNGNYIPKCIPTECIGEIIGDEINKTLSVPAGLLFVLDESGSVGASDFRLTLDFVINITNAFKLSKNRTAGVITFDSSARLAIHMNEESTTTFQRKVKSIPYHGGGTDILKGLKAAIAEIQGYARHNLTLVFLITDGISETDGTPAANILKANKNALFTIGVGSTRLEHLENLASTADNGIRHFFHVRSYSVLKSIGQYLNPPVTSGGGGGSRPSNCSSK